MKIVVIGGTGQGLDTALVGAQVVVDVANSPSVADEAVRDFFRTSGRNLLAAEARAGVRHRVALSVVADPQALYFGAPVDDDTLVPAGQARLGTVTFAQWMAR